MPCASTSVYITNSSNTGAERRYKIRNLQEGGLTSLHLITKDELQTQFEVLQQRHTSELNVKLRPHAKHRPLQNPITTEFSTRNQTTA